MLQRKSSLANSMAASSRMKLSSVRALFRLMGEVRELGSDPQVWRPHMIRCLRRLLDAQVVVSSEVHLRRAPGGATRVIDIGWGCDSDSNVWRIHNEQNDAPEHYWLSAGQVLPDVVGDRGDEGVPIAVKPTRPTYGGTSFILSQCPLPHIGAVDQLGVHRAWGQAAFTPAEHRLARIFHLELARLWKADALRKAKDPRVDLPPRLSQTLGELLTGASEKQIALKLELSQHTIHNYVKALHQRFGVSSRGELLAKAGQVEQFRPRLSRP
jgi:DNA-binding CsgD family transcriptional regulator